MICNNINICPRINDTVRDLQRRAERPCLYGSNDEMISQISLAKMSSDLDLMSKDEGPEKISPPSGELIN